MPKQLVLSATTLKLYLECPRCFWMHMNKGVQRPRGPFPSLPTGMDRILKRYFDHYRPQGLLPPLIAGKLTGRLVTDGEGLTLGWTDPELDARLFGKLDDCLILEGGKRAPLDHKTRASAPESVRYTETYYLFQMNVYSLLLERNGYPISRNAYVVYYYPLDGALHEGIPFGVTIHDVKTDPEAAYTIFQEAARALTDPLPPSAHGCAFCQWAAASRMVTVA